jgi:uncharacterized protein
MATPSLNDIILRLQQELPRLQSLYDVQTLELFGSYARQEQDADSDLDVLVTFERTPGLWRFIELEHHLSEILGVPVDLVTEDSLKPRVGERVLREVIRV